MGKYNTLFTLDIKMLNLASKVLTLSRLPMMAKNKNCLKQNIELKKYKKSDKCYVIGLGPSLKNIDLRKLDGDTIVTNRFTNYVDAGAINPTFYCLPDSAFYHDKEARDVLIRALEMFKDTAFLLNGKDKDIAYKIIGNKENVFYTYTWNGYLNPKKELDFCKILPLIGNVVCYAIMLALYLGYKEIVLLGCDFSSFASQKSSHCYEESDESRKITMSYDLFCYSFVAYIHLCLEKYAKRKGIRIINATEGSLIDAYQFDEKLMRFLKKEEE